MSLKVTTYFPGELLKPFVKSYHVVDAVGDATNHVLPDASPVLIFRFKGHLDHESATSGTNMPMFAISGIRNSARLIKYSHGSSHIVVRLKEALANSFFEEPLNEFYKDNLSLDLLDGYKDLSWVEDNLAKSTDDGARIRVIESYMASKLKPRSIDTRIVSAVQQVVRSKGQVKISTLAHDHNMSQDAFEKRFRQIVGAPPKAFANIIRLKSVIDHGRSGKSLTEIAIDAGFFDQSHFNRDFKLFTGQNPSQFFQEGPRW